MATQEILTIIVCCVSLVFLQILKYYIVKCHVLERKVRALSYQKEQYEIS